MRTNLKEKAIVAKFFGVRHEFCFVVTNEKAQEKTGCPRFKGVFYVYMYYLFRPQQWIG